MNEIFQETEIFFSERHESFHILTCYTIIQPPWQSELETGGDKLVRNSNETWLAIVPYTMLPQVHNIYQTNPAFKKRICLCILWFNTVNQWEIITQSSCRRKWKNKFRKSVRAVVFNPTCVSIYNLSMLLGHSPDWKRLLVLSHLRHY